jgi:hypothetical protein
MQADTFHAKVVSDYQEIVGKVQALGRELREADAECKSLSDRIQGETQVLQVCTALAKINSMKIKRCKMRSRRANAFGSKSIENKAAWHVPQIRPFDNVACFGGGP